VNGEIVTNEFRGIASRWFPGDSNSATACSFYAQSARGNGRIFLVCSEVEAVVGVSAPCVLGLREWERELPLYPEARTVVEVFRREDPSPRETIGMVGMFPQPLKGWKAAIEVTQKHMIFEIVRIGDAPFSVVQDFGNNLHRGTILRWQEGNPGVPPCLKKNLSQNFCGMPAPSIVKFEEFMGLGDDGPLVRLERTLQWVVPGSILHKTDNRLYFILVASVPGENVIKNILQVSCLGCPPEKFPCIP
jgi:hypothetical protein